MPLFDYAQRLPPTPLAQLTTVREQLKGYQAEMERHRPPSDEECVHTLGASRFARQYDDLGLTLSRLTDYDGAISAYEKALACTPRAPNLHAELASELLHAGRLAEARAAADRGLSIDRQDLALGGVVMQLDFIDEHWADAVARLRVLAVTEPDAERATYWLCFLWLAQRRAGVRQPDLPARTPPWEGWPAHVLDVLKGDTSEAELVEVIEKQKNEQRRREVLVEALYYLGELKLADGNAQAARRYFATVVNLQVPYFIEHHMARAEIVKMRGAAAGNRVSDALR
jgi:tetratricopeptide (TPR) repeat protein